MNHNEFRQRAVIAAMQGILSNSGGAIQANSMNGWGLVNTDPEAISILAHDIADAMLAEEIKRHGGDTATSDWIEWNGGECPVDPDTVVEVELKDGSLQSDKAQLYWWPHLNNSGDIIRYRIIGEK